MSKISHAKQLYATQNALTGEFLKFGAKIGWAASTAAKNAFSLHMSENYRWLYGELDSYGPIKGLFDIQQDYKLVVFDNYGTCSVVTKGE